MRKITPELTEDLLKYTSPENVAKSDAFSVSSYKELRKHIAQLSYANKDFILFFRGQNRDYKNSKSGKSTFYPSMYRGDKLDKTELKHRWHKLNTASEIFLKRLRLNYPNKTYIIKRKRIVQWSILQHYEVTETPLIDVTQSLKVACSFAMLGNNNPDAYVYVFALPYYTNRISVNSEHYLTNVRLLSVAPPQALRPYYQEGFLIGEDEFSETYANKDELDLNNRLVAKFKFENKNEFWGESETALTVDDLYPKDDDIEELCKDVSLELYNQLAKDYNGIDGNYYYEFMQKWTEIERMLNEYIIINKTPNTIVMLINNITDTKLKKQLQKIRHQRNYLTHYDYKGSSIKEFVDINEISTLIVQLKNYLQRETYIAVR